MVQDQNAVPAWWRHLKFVLIDLEYPGRHVKIPAAYASCDRIILGLTV